MIVKFRLSGGAKSSSFSDTILLLRNFAGATVKVWTLPKRKLLFSMFTWSLLHSPWSRQQSWNDKVGEW